MYKNKILIPFTCSILLFYNFSLNSMSAMLAMAAQMGGQQGASMANMSVSEMYQKMGTSLQKDNTVVQNSLQQFSSQLSLAQTNNAQTLNQIFSNSISNISTEETNLSTYSKEMQSYIAKAINTTKPPFYYILSNADIFDQAFSNGTMDTPSGPLWKNIFQYGDWEYDGTTDSFYQFANVPLFSIDSKTQQQSSSNASYNNIFTEYITFSKSYEIKCEVTIYQIKYPFFVGIQFNKTRWISGNSDSLTTSRLIGIFGSSQTDIGTYYSEQPTVSFFNTTTPSNTKQSNNSTNTAKTNTDNSSTATTTTTTTDATQTSTTNSPSTTADSNNTTLQLAPLDQIVQNKVPQQSQIESSLFSDIYTTPVTFIIKIVTSPQKINFKIWQKGSKEPSSFITTQSVDKNLYLYHNIGFICSGAIAQFHLTKPQNLLFSQTSIATFSQAEKALLAPQQ